MGGYSPGVFIAFTSIFTSTLLLLAVGNLIRVYRTDDIAEMGGAWPRLRTTSIALGSVGAARRRPRAQLVLRALGGLQRRRPGRWQSSALASGSS